MKRSYLHVFGPGHVGFYRATNGKEWRTYGAPLVIEVRSEREKRAQKRQWTRAGYVVRVIDCGVTE